MIGIFVKEYFCFIDLLIMMVKTTRSQCSYKLDTALNGVLQEVTVYASALIILMNHLHSTFTSTTGTFRCVFFLIFMNRNSFNELSNYVEDT